MFDIFKKFFRKKNPKELTQKKKQERALEYVEELIKAYDLKMKDSENVFLKIGNCMNSMELIKIKAQLLTNQIIVTDELLFELEKALMNSI